LPHRCKRLPLFALIIPILVLPGRAYSSGLQADFSAHILLAELGDSWGPATDLTLAASWAPIPEVAIGLEGAILFPLPASGEDQKTEVALRANPAAWLRFGEPEMWSYLKLGCGVESHVLENSTEPVMVLVAAAGFAVAPRELMFHFGFEISGELDILGEVITRTVGLGGFLGFKF
jgi:hypothetical protein